MLGVGATFHALELVRSFGFSRALACCPVHAARPSPTRGFAVQVARRVRSSKAGLVQSKKVHAVRLGEHKNIAGGDVPETIEALPKEGPYHVYGVHEGGAVESGSGSDYLPLSEAKLRAIFSRTLIEHGLMPVSAEKGHVQADY